MYFRKKTSGGGRHTTALAITVDEALLARPGVPSLGWLELKVA
jgi:hypothetical protein